MWAVGWLMDLGDLMLYQKSLDESSRMGRRIVVMKLIAHLAIVKATVTQYTRSVNGVSLPTD